MTEQEQIIQNFRDKSQEIITKHSTVTTERPDFTASLESEITELADEILNGHSNMPNIDTEQLKEDLDSAVKVILIAQTGRKI